MSSEIEILRYAAFAKEPTGGNPAGVVLQAEGLTEAAMQSAAAAVGYSETAFVTRRAIGGDPRRHQLRYFSPSDEVPFCGHATLATGFALAERHGVGKFTFETPIGIVEIDTVSGDQGITAAFTSVEPAVKAVPDDVLDSLLDLLGFGRRDLSTHYPPRLAYAGNWHPILVLNDKTLFDTYGFEPAALRNLMRQQGWMGTVTTMYRLSSHEFEARNPFPVGAITEDPATGSAAAAFGGYLRALSLIETPGPLTIHQGRHVGRDSVLTVTIPAVGGIRVSGTVVEISAVESTAAEIGES
jgi:PhzF family phenazine biosynthesis protein